MLTFIKFLIKLNPWKVTILFFTMLCISLTLFLNSIKTPKVEITEYLVGFHNDQIILIYTGEHGTSSVTRGWKVKEKYSSDIIKDNKLIIKKDGYVFGSIIIGLLVGTGFLIGTFIILCIVEIVGGEDGGLFNLDLVYHEYYYTKIEMTQEGDWCYYSIGDRLLAKEKNIKYDCYYSLEKYIKNKKLLPKWEGTTQEKREQKLNSLLQK